MLSLFTRGGSNAGGAVTPEALRDELEQGARLVLLDVREPDEHAEARLPGSLLIPLGELDRRLDELDPQSDLVVYCRSGARSALACAWLRRAGFTRVRNLTGGILRWRGRLEPGA